MRLGPKIVTFAAVLLAAVLSYFSAVGAAGLIERMSARAVQSELIAQGYDWAKVETDGLQVIITGTAPTEAMRFRTMVAAGSVVDATRAIDAMEVLADKPLAPPTFSVELLRNDDGLSLIGLIPTSYDRAPITEAVEALANGVNVSDLLETADYPVPDGWDTTMTFALEVLTRLPRSKISVSSGELRVKAISTSSREKAALEKSLRDSAPRNVRLALEISAPRPVITPFTLRFAADPANGSGARFDACSADTPVSRARILLAARKAGLKGDVDCTLGLGAPSTEWADAAEQSIQAIGTLGGGSVTISDTDVTLVALPTAPQRIFDQVVGALESNLPDGFSLTSVLPEPVKVDGTGSADQGPPEFVATRSPEGQVQLRGRVSDDRMREVIESFAQSRFGAGQVYTAARLDPTLPEGWPLRVLAALQALAELNHGSVVVQPDYLELRGVSGNENARAEIARQLSEGLGEGENFELAVTYEEALDPLAGLPTAQECIDRINLILNANKISFEPGSVEIAGASARVVDDIADVMKACAKVDMQIVIGGHTDSQGREEMNLSLSQQRADAVLNALTERRVLTSNVASVGYGETAPIADNDTEEGREANRRIEFRLAVPEDLDEDSAAAASDDASTPDPTDPPAQPETEQSE